jgi:hypothetical protein
MVAPAPVSAVTLHDPRAEARAVAGPGYDPRVLEPSPPAVAGDPWWADDPVDPRSPVSHAQVLSPVSGLGDLTWSTWAMTHATPTVGWLGDRWLAHYRRLQRPPARYDDARRALHRMAVYVLSPARQHATGGKMALRWTRGGIGTPFFGAAEQVRVEGTRLIRQRGDEAWATPITTLAHAAAFVLDDEPDTTLAASLDVPPLGDAHAPFDIDTAAAAAVADWFGFAWSVLEEVRADPESVEASRVQLWPEHFDAAFECLDGNRRAGFGMSPGDAAQAEPYAYVTLWHAAQVPPDPLWNADEFAGAILPLSEFVHAEDQRRTVIAFFRARRRLLADSAMVRQ